MEVRSLVRRNRRRLVPAITVLTVAGLALAFRGPLVAWFTMQPVGESSSEAVTSSAGALSIEARIGPDPPQQNGNTLWIEATGPGGEPVEEADVEVVYSMPAMGSMPEMRGEARVSNEGDGRYRADFDLPMGGSWTLEADIRSPQGSASPRYTMTVGSKGLTPASTGEATAPSTSAILDETAFRFAEPVLDDVRAAFDSYESARAMLANGRLEGLAAKAGEIAASLVKARRELVNAPAGVAECLNLAANAAERLARAESLADARSRFGEVSRYLLAMAAADPRLRDEPRM